MSKEFKPRIILNRGNYHDYYSSTGIETCEVLVGESETIPGQGITPTEIVARYINKQALPQLNGVFNDSSMIPDRLERMDKVEIIELARHTRNMIATRTEKMRQRRAKARAASDSALKEASAGNNPPPGGQGGEPKSGAKRSGVQPEAQSE